MGANRLKGFMIIGLASIILPTYLDIAGNFLEYSAPILYVCQGWICRWNDPAISYGPPFLWDLYVYSYSLYYGRDVWSLVVSCGLFLSALLTALGSYLILLDLRSLRAERTGLGRILLLCGAGTCTLLLLLVLVLSGLHIHGDYTATGIPGLVSWWDSRQVIAYTFFAPLIAFLGSFKPLRKLSGGYLTELTRKEIGAEPERERAVPLMRTREPAQIPEMPAQVRTVQSYEISVSIPSVAKIVTLEVASDHTVGSLVETLVSTLDLPKDRTYTVEHSGEHTNSPDFGKSLGTLGIKEGSKLTLCILE